MGDEDARVPYEATLAQLWENAPMVNPNEFDDWPMDRVYRFNWYLSTRNKMKDELGSKK